MAETKNVEDLNFCPRKLRRYKVLKRLYIAVFVLFILLMGGIYVLICNNKQTPLVISTKTFAIEYDENMKSRIVRLSKDGEQPICDYRSSQCLISPNDCDEDYKFDRLDVTDVDDGFGKGKRYTVIGLSKDIQKTVTLSVYDNFPSFIFTNTKYKNIGTCTRTFQGWKDCNYSVSAEEKAATAPFFSFQGSSSEDRADWVLPLKNGFCQKNYMGMNDADYGGGIPVSDVWRSDFGIAVGHCESVPKLVSLPVAVQDDRADISVLDEHEIVLKPGDETKTLDMFVSVHTGDFFGTLKEFRRILEIKGLKFAPINQSVYEATWCSWGYERGFKVEEILNALPMVKKLGFKWVCIDDGWQYEEGDLELNKTKFPDGEKGIKELIRKIHDQGFKVQLWWVPMACDPKSNYYKNHPEDVILDENGKPCEITWWDNYYLCPAKKSVREFTKKSVRKILEDWDFDGLKIDGQHLNAAPLCYNKDHHHKTPEESYNAVPGFFKMIYDEAKKIKPDAPIMFCPCGCCYSVYTMPYFDMPVASDPESSWQVRLKGKVFKALMNGNIPYNGDHVELSDNMCDFASTVGIGGVINTKFTWPVGTSPVSVVDEGANFDLTEKKEALYKKWLDIYRDKMLSKGKYLGELYTFGFDYPECHAIKKDGNMYYAFYSNSFEGDVELRGLEDKAYTVTDYVNNVQIATLKPGENKVKLKFDDFALLEVKAIKEGSAI